MIYVRRVYVYDRGKWVTPPPQRTGRWTFMDISLVFAPFIPEGPPPCVGCQHFVPDETCPGGVLPGVVPPCVPKSRYALPTSNT